MLSLRSRQQGDSIVEVLISIAVISLVLVTAYVITNRNTQAVQDSQERIQAQHIAESQIEALKAQGSLGHSDSCFIGTTETSASNPGSPCDNITHPDGSSTGGTVPYKVRIQGPDAQKTYQISVVWTSINASSGDNSDVTMYYRLH